MDPKYTTIDRIPLEYSKRYAELLQKADETLLRESTLVSGKTTIASTTPYHVASEFDYLFSAFPSFTKAATIASFLPPLSYNIIGCFSDSFFSWLSSDHLEELSESSALQGQGKEVDAIRSLLKLVQEKNQEIRLIAGGRNKFLRG